MVWLIAEKKLTIISFNFVCIFIENIILTSCDYTLLKVYSSLAFSNILILFAVKLSVTLIPVPFNFFLVLYILLGVLYLTNFTIIGRGLAFFEDLDLPNLCDLSIFSGLIVSSLLCCGVLMIFSSASSTVYSTISCTKRQLRCEYCSCLSTAASISPSLLFKSCFLFLNV